MTITGKPKEVADAIREKTGTHDLMRIDQMDELITGISDSELTQKLIDMGRVREL